MPGFLGSQTRFKELFRTPIEKQGDPDRLTQLRARITPFMLRRTKALVASELPPKIETVMRVELAGKQADLYETIRLGMEKTVPLFLISLKAGGVGLNLPQADTVIHYDPWWNPAVEAQGTIEERILALQERKAALSESMYSGSVGRKQPLFSEGRSG